MEGRHESGGPAVDPSESDLWHSYFRRRSITNRNRLADRYYWLVKVEIDGAFGGRVKRDPGCYVNMDTLYSAGAEGLLRGIACFRSDGGASPETYLRRRIRGWALDEMRRMDYLSKRDRDREREAEKAQRRVGDDPLKIAESLGVPIEDAVRALTLRSRVEPTSLDSLGRGGDEDRAYEPSASDDGPDSALVALEALKDEWEDMTFDHKMVMVLRYFHGISLRKIVSALEPRAFPVRRYTFPLRFWRLWKEVGDRATHGKTPVADETNSADEGILGSI